MVACRSLTTWCSNAPGASPPARRDCWLHFRCSAESRAKRWLRLLGSSPERELSAELSELLSAALVVRRATASSSPTPFKILQLAPKIASALGSFELVERVSALIIEDDAAPARALLTLGDAPFLPNQRDALLERAALLARRVGVRSDETDALFALAATKSQRTSERLLRLERLTRHSGGNHPQVLAWLIEAAERDPTLALWCASSSRASGTLGRLRAGRVGRLASRTGGARTR